MLTGNIMRFAGVFGGCDGGEPIVFHKCFV